MQLIVLGSGSLGNGYVLKASTGETLVIEAGCHLSKLEEAMNWDFSGIAGCIISHRHMDHAQWAKDYKKAGLRMYMNQDTMDHWQVEGTLLASTQQLMIGNFKVKPLEVAHDVECLAFLIDHPEMGRMFFITDSSYCQWNLSAAKIQNWMVEANYDFPTLEQVRQAGMIDKDRYDRILNGHFSIQNCKDFLAANDLSHTVRIVLLHASRQNGNTVQFKREIEDQTGKDVFIAKAGLVIPSFGPTPF
ncbi:hypothetical protein [Dyadobacter sp. CY312]|uniref:hypothetical protein n=1 Tax=Dyadobacter sp. CY312 TaxID=2907303 RepID=UPI001F1E4492|nr:hypothetical protein [Dyadobacter sp. CY312]MCE7039284.1 hypothetical protein [Dyadobacter sp. CY312]